MKKILFFPLWKIDHLEEYLEKMEMNGYRLICIRNSYCFYFKKAVPKEMRYFLSYKSFRGKSMGAWDYALTSKHNADPIESKMCFFNMYRTKVQKEKMTLLYEGRMDYIKGKLLEKGLTALFCTTLFTAIFFMNIIMRPTDRNIGVIGVFLAICFCLTLYYFFGYFKQKSKCMKYARDKLNR